MPVGGQPVAVLVEIHQREGRAQPLMVLTYAPVAHLGKSEDALQNAERMLHFGSNSRLSRVCAPGIFIHIVLVSSSAASHDRSPPAVVARAFIFWHIGSIAGITDVHSASSGESDALS
jgi:hypothetical protein